MAEITRVIMEKDELQPLADNIKILNGTQNEEITLSGMESVIQSSNAEIESQAAKLAQALSALNGKAASGGSGEVKLQEKTVNSSTSKQTVQPDSGYDGLSKVTVNAMATATQAVPSISVSSAGLITASATQTAGYVAAGTKSATQQLSTQAAQTITPGTSNKTIASGKYLTGTQTIKGDANLVAGNIKSGVSIFGVSGTLSIGEDVTTETNAYTGLLEELESIINTLPNAGSGGGPEITTAKLTIINNSSETTVYIAFHQYSNGDFIYKDTFADYGEQTVFENAVIKLGTEPAHFFIYAGDYDAPFTVKSITGASGWFHNDKTYYFMGMDSDITVTIQ